MNLVTSEQTSITCHEGHQLAATSFSPKQAVKGAILFGPATGVKRPFYQSFTILLATNGQGVITFDNRGIGDSLVGNINDCDASLQSWGQQD